MLKSLQILFCFVGALLTTQTQAAADNGQLLIFHTDDGSAVAMHFKAEALPSLKELAEEAGLDLQIIDPRNRDLIPDDVTITPLIAFQNHRGRSVYQGRYTTLDRVKNFVRTSRYMPQGDEPLVREDLPVWEIGAAKVATPIKITAIETSSSGALRTAPGFFDPIYESIDQAEPRFDWQERVELRRADRMFYVDFYPYLDDGGMPNSGEGTLYLSMAIYSQFHCHDPVWTLDGEQLNGPWQKRTEIFAKGYGKAAEEIARQIEQSELGDGFVPIMDQDQPRVPWSEPYFKLPAAPEGADRAAIAEVELVQDWQIDTTAQDDRPAVMFAFPAPQDAYSGEATYVTGNLKLGEDLSIEGMRGKFIADPASVTMGEPDLDAAIHSSMLEVETYPESTFDIQRVETDFDQPQFNQVAAAVLHGRFTMRGETIPLSVPVSLEAFLGEDGKARLSIDGQWKLRLKDPFAIDGPPGDAPTNDTLIFNCHLVFEPAEGGE